jgi:hypothetical protein
MGIACLPEVVRTSSPSSPSSHGLPVLRLNDLGIEIILEDVRAGLALAFHSHARADDLGQAVNVVGFDAAIGLDPPAHGFGPRLGAEDAHAQGQILDIEAEFRSLINQVEEIAGRAANGSDAKVFHDHQLALGVASGNRDDRSAERFGSVMRSEPAREQAVAVSVLDDVAFVQAAGGEAAQHDIGPDLDVLLRVGHDDGLAGGPAGGVQPHNVLHRAGEQAEGVGVAQVGLLGKGQPGQYHPAPARPWESARARPSVCGTGRRHHRRAARSP